MKITKEFVFRILIYTLGLLFLAFATVFAINSNLGTSPVNSLPFAVSVVTGLQLSTAVIIVFSSYIALQAILLRKQFKWYNIFQIAFSTLFGYFTDFAKWVLGDFCLPTYFGKLAMLAVSIVMIAIGIALYVDAQLIPMPPEGLTDALSRTLHIKFPNMKIIQDCVVTGCAVIITLIATGAVAGVREGTVLSALLVGKVLAVVQKWIRPTVDKLCRQPEAAANKNM